MTKAEQGATPRLLPPCPFCGAMPEVEAAAGGAEDVACFNVHCLTQPRSLGVAGEMSGREVWSTRANQWQPIETVPKDGTRVLIFISSDDDGECHKIAYWSDLAARPGWFYRGGWCEEAEPDGWMPLPAAPALTEQTEAKRA